MCPKSGTAITGGGSWFHRMIVRGKNEYLYIFMFVLIVCCSTIWNPHTTSNINKLESVQKNAARFVLNKPHDYKKPDSTTKMVKDFKETKYF
jgi:uncharacterized membrane protein